MLYVSGPGGIGKSWLLSEFAELAGELGWRSTRVDARTIEPSSAGFLAGLVGVSGDGTSLEAVTAGWGRRVLLIDAYERLAPLDGWIREELLPSLPREAMVVIASRRPPAAPWRTDGGWPGLMRLLSLRNLAPADVAMYLRAADLPASLDDRVLALTHGHPLALAVLVDVLSTGPGDAGRDPLAGLDANPDLVALLLERFVEHIPSERARQALEVCAHSRFTSETLLRRVLGGVDAQELFDWLRTLSFVESGRLGLFPHDLARDVLDLDLRWRDRERYDELHQQIRRACVERVRRAQGLERRHASADIVFLHRTSPRVGPYFDWPELGDAYVDDVGVDDRGSIVAMAERHEGPEAAALVAHWLTCQPDAFLVFRRGGRVPIGFLAMLHLQRATAVERDADPGTRAMWAHAHRGGPLRAGDSVVACRFLMDGDAYQGPSASFSLTGIRCIELIVSNPNLAWHYAVFAEPNTVEGLFEDLDYRRADGAGFVVGGRTYAVFAHDFRVVPAEQWLEVMGDRERALDAPGCREPTVSLGTLSYPEFAEAVRDVLRNALRPDRLTRNPLLGSRIARARGGPGTSPAVLVELVRDAADVMGRDQRDEKYRRAVDRTYLRPAATQERAAEVLDLPFSTYRRHLARGITGIVDLMWQQELYDTGAPTDQR